MGMRGPEIGHRGLLMAAGALAAAPFVGSALAQTNAGAGGSAGPGGSVAPEVTGRRRLGTLEVSSLGLASRT